MQRRWFHRTCEHGFARIQADDFRVLPNPHPVLGGVALSWWTPIQSASRESLGLTSHTLNCDRMAFLLEATEEDARFVAAWHDFKPYLPGAERLEASRGVKPALWGIAARPIRAAVVLAPAVRGRR